MAVFILPKLGSGSISPDRRTEQSLKKLIALIENRGMVKEDRRDRREEALRRGRCILPAGDAAR